MLVELVQYTDPPGRPWPPGYRISDQGLLNIAFGFRRARRVRGGPCGVASRRGCAETAPRCGSGPGRSSTSTTIRGSASSCSTWSPGTRGRWGFGPAPRPGSRPSRGAPRRGCEPNGASRRRWSPAPPGASGPSSAGWRPRTRPRSCSLDRDADGLARLAAELGDGVEVATREVDFADLEAVDAAAARAGRRASGHRPVDRRRRPRPGPVPAGLRLAPGARRLHRQLALQPGAALAPRAGDGAARRRPRDRDRQPRGAGRDAVRGPLQRQQGGPGGDRRVRPGRAASRRGSPSRRSSRASSTRRCSAPTPSRNQIPPASRVAFARRRHPYPIAPRDAAERIYMATLRRRESLHFPAREHAKLRLARLLPARLRDPMTRRRHEPPDAEHEHVRAARCHRVPLGSPASPPPVERY